MSEDRTRSLRPSGASLPAPPPPRISDWLVDHRLGGGGFGDVFSAHHARSGARAALKVLHAQLVASPEMLARFDREIRVLARLQHPNIVQVVDAGFAADGRPYLAMELLEGQDLSASVKARGPMSPAAARGVFEPLCDAIAFAHDIGIIHRDLKGSNVFLCANTGRVVLLDFGIAKVSDALAPELTASHQSLGTPGCMAPEQIHGGRVDARTDVYSLGALLFHVLVGKPAFYDPSETMTQYLHLHARRPRASAVAPVPPSVDDVIVRAMAIEPGDRYESVRALMASLRVALRDSVSHGPVSSIEHVALFVTVGDRTGGAELDEPLIADLEGVLPAAERALAEQGFAMALDLGSSAIFLAPARQVVDPLAAARVAWDRLATRSGRDARVRIGICAHRGAATIAGQRVEPCALLRPETWGMPEPLEGVWVTAALSPVLHRVV